MDGHPIRNAELHIFERVNKSDNGSDFVARFHPYDTWPVFFKGQTREEAERKAAQFKQECLDKHEVDCIARQQRAEAMRKRKAESR